MVPHHSRVEQAVRLWPSLSPRFLAEPQGRLAEALVAMDHSRAASALAVVVGDRSSTARVGLVETGPREAVVAEAVALEPPAELAGMAGLATRRSLFSDHERCSHH